MKFKIEIGLQLEGTDLSREWPLISGMRKKKPGRPRRNWRDIIQQDLKSIGMTWEVAQQLAVNREGWHQRVV